MPNIVHLAIPGFIFLIIVEAVFSARQNSNLYERKDTAASLSMGIGNIIIKLFIMSPIIGLYYFVYQHRIFDIGTGATAWLLLFILEDLTFYVFHRVSHQCRFFWASHVNHHSSQKYNLSTALRQTWTGVFTGFLFWLWLPLLGFHPLMVATMQAISLLYQFWIHTKTIDKLSLFEVFMNTPSHHRVHHGSNPKYLDRNHGGILIIWDKIFGTFQPEEDQATFGLIKNINTFNPLKIAMHEWMAIWEDINKPNPFFVRFGYIFHAPGWSHDGSNQTVKQMRGIGQ